MQALCKGIAASKSLTTIKLNSLRIDQARFSLLSKAIAESKAKIATFKISNMKIGTNEAAYVRDLIKA